MKQYFERNWRGAESLIDEKIELIGELGCIRKLREELQEADGPCSSPAGDCDGLCDTCVFNPENMTAGDGDA